MNLRQIAAAAGLVLALAPAAAQNNPLGALNSILNAVQQQPGKAAPAHPLGALLAPAQPPAAAAQPAGIDFISLLSQDGPIDEAKEIAIGRQLAAVLLGSKPMHAGRGAASATSTSSVAGSPCRRPARCCPGPSPCWTTRASMPSPRRAVMCSSPSGLVDRVDEAELAGILAHEITHVTERAPPAARCGRRRAPGALTQLAASQIRTGSAVGSLVLAAGAGAWPATSTPAAWTSRTSSTPTGSGVVFAARAGFDPYGLPGVLQQLRTQAPDDPLFALSLSTHPPAQQRLDALAVAMGDRLDAFTARPVVGIDQRLAWQR